MRQFDQFVVVTCVVRVYRGVFTTVQVIIQAQPQAASLLLSVRATHRRDVETPRRFLPLPYHFLSLVQGEGSLLAQNIEHNGIAGTLLARGVTPSRQ